MEKETIAVDIDNVIFPFSDCFLDFHNKKYGTNLVIDDFPDYYSFNKIADSREEAQRRMREYILTLNPAEIEPIDGAKETLITLKEKYNLVVVSARDNVLKEATSFWLEYHLNGLFNEILFCSNMALKKKMTKAEACRMADAKWMIEDGFEYAQVCAEMGMNVLLFGDYPWNRHCENLSERINRVRNWQEVLDYFKLI